MISRKLLKAEIDKVRSEYLTLLYGIIKLFERNAREDLRSAPAEVQATEANAHSNWHDFVASTYGCLADTPISRGQQGLYESREAMG